MTEIKYGENSPLPIVRICSFQKETQGYDVKEDKPTVRMTCSLSLGGVPCDQKICPLQLIIANLKLLQPLEFQMKPLIEITRSQVTGGRIYYRYKWTSEDKVETSLIVPGATYYHEVVKKVLVGNRRYREMGNKTFVKGPETTGKFLEGIRKNSSARYGVWRSMLRARMDADEIIDTLENTAPIVFIE
jgi:hypothetical protein